MDINLMPRPIKRSARMRMPVRGRWPWMVMGAAVVIVCASAIVVAHLAVARSSASLQALQQQVQALQSQTESVSASASSQAEQQAQQIAATSPRYDVILRDLVRDLAPDTTIDSIQQTAGAVTIAGRSASVADVAAFEAAVQKESFVTSATLSAASLQDGQAQASTTGQAPIGYAIAKGPGGSSYRYVYTLTVVLRTGGGTP